MKNLALLCGVFLTLTGIQTSFVYAKAGTKHEDDIRVVVFRAIIPKRADKEFKVYFLSVEGQDPSKAFINRLTGFSNPLKKESESYVDPNAKDYGWSCIKDKKTKEQGIRFSVGKITWLRKNTVSVRAGYSAGGLNAGSSSYTLKLQQGHWKVTKTSDSIVS